MVEVKRIKAPSDIPAEGSYVLVLFGPSAMDREHPRGRTLTVRDGKRDKVKLDEFAAAVETAKNLAETKHFQTVYVIDESRHQESYRATEAAVIHLCLAMHREENIRSNDKSLAIPITLPTWKRRRRY